MKLDKSKSMVAAMICLYLAIGIIVAMIYASSHSSKDKGEIEYTFTDSGKAGEIVELNTVAELGDRGDNPSSINTTTGSTSVNNSSAKENNTTTNTTNASDISATDKHFYSFTVTTSGSDQLRVREEPNKNAKVVGNFKSSDTGFILIKGLEWSYVTDGKTTGYCYNAFLNMTEISVHDLPDYYPAEYRVETNTEINF